MVRKTGYGYTGEMLLAIRAQVKCNEKETEGSGPYLGVCPRLFRQFVPSPKDHELTLRYRDKKAASFFSPPQPEPMTKQNW